MLHIDPEPLTNQGDDSLLEPFTTAPPHPWLLLTPDQISGVNAVTQACSSYQKIAPVHHDCSRTLAGQLNLVVFSENQKGKE